MDTNPNPASAPAPAVERATLLMSAAEIRDAFTVAAAFTDPGKPTLALAKIDASADGISVTVTDSFALTVIYLPAAVGAPFTTYADPTAIRDAAAALTKYLGANLSKRNDSAAATLTPDAFTLSRTDYTTTTNAHTDHSFPAVARIVEMANENTGPHPYEATGYLPAQLARIAKHANPGRPVAFSTYNGPTKPARIDWQTKAGAEVQTIQMPARIRS